MGCYVLVFAKLQKRSVKIEIRKLKLKFFLQTTWNEQKYIIELSFFLLIAIFEIISVRLTLMRFLETLAILSEKNFSVASVYS
jgi:hypothetical protein